MTAVGLFIWVATLALERGYSAQYNWVQLSTFTTMERCEAAIKQLALDPSKSRCIIGVAIK